MENQTRLKELLLEQYTKQHAHVGFDTAVEGLTGNDIGTRPEGLPHSIWELTEHIRIAQHDILDFSRNSDYKSLDWPDDYWPSSPRPEDQQEWEHSKESFQQDKEEMEKFIQQTDLDLMEPLAHGKGQTLFREILLIIEHNAYHIGQIVQVRRLLGNWK